jgi:hypothetical protein
MNPRVANVKTEQNFTLLITFNNGEVKKFDVKPYLGIGIFKELKNLSLFNSVKPFLGSIQWANGVDLCPDTIYLESKYFILNLPKLRVCLAMLLSFPRSRRT